MESNPFWVWFLVTENSFLDSCEVSLGKVPCSLVLPVQGASGEQAAQGEKWVHSPKVAIVYTWTLSLQTLH